MTNLATIAETAGCTDPDILKCASPGLSPVRAVADLQRRFPAAFAKPKRYGEMTPAERTAFDRLHRITGRSR